MEQRLDILRVIKLIDWLVFDGKIKNRRDLAEKIGYTESSFSQILNGKVKLSERFIKKLAMFDERINVVWLLSGEGSMIKDEIVNIGEVSGGANTIGMSVNQSISKNSGQNAGRDLINHRDKSLLEELAAQRHLAERQLEVYSDSLSNKDDQIRTAQSQIDTLIKQNQEQFNRFMSLIQNLQSH